MVHRRRPTRQRPKARKRRSKSKRDNDRPLAPGPARHGSQPARGRASFFQVHGSIAQAALPSCSLCRHAVKSIDARDSNAALTCRALAPVHNRNWSAHSRSWWSWAPCRGRPQPAGRRGPARRRTGAGFGRKQLQHPQPTFVTANPAMARDIRNLLIVFVSIQPALANGERQVTRLGGSPPRRAGAAEFLRESREEFATEPYPLANDVQTQPFTFRIISRRERSGRSGYAECMVGGPAIGASIASKVLKAAGTLTHRWSDSQFDQGRLKRVWLCA